MLKIVVIASAFAAACVTSDEPTAETAAGVGSGSGCYPPSLTTIVAPSPIMTELRTTNRVTVVVASSSFASSPTVTLQAFDANTNLPVSGWTITPPQIVTLPATGTAIAGFDVVIPSDSATLSANLRARAQAGGVTADGWGSITALRQVTLEWPAGLGSSPHTTLVPTEMQVRNGTVVRWYNADGIQHALHGQSGILHEMTSNGFPGAYFTAQATAPGVATWYCHTHGGTANHVTIIP